MDLMSSAFTSGDTIPNKYTCDGENISPPLSWTGVPEDTAALVLVVDDPDAPNGVFTHWVLYNMAPDRRALDEGISPGNVGDVGSEGRNNFGNQRYDGPCPPTGPAHTYYFRLYALDAPLDLPAGATRAQVLDEMHNVLAHTELLGRYRRERPSS